MRTKIILMVNMLLILVLLAGYTGAWFTGGAKSTGAFTAGTVRLRKPQLTSSTDLKAGDCNLLTWTFTNAGSKASFIRVKPNVTGKTSGESAWLQGIPLPGGGWQGQYINYEKGMGSEDNPFNTCFIQGGDQNIVGYASVWDDGNQLFLDLRPVTGVAFESGRHYVGLTPPTTHAPGQYHDNLDINIDGFVFLALERVALEFEDKGFDSYACFKDVQEVYIAAKLDFYYSIAGEPEIVVGDWIRGDDGWWYYGTSSAPISVPPGESITVTFEICVPEGYSGSINASLEAEAVQTTHGAINFKWPTNPWK